MGDFLAKQRKIGSTPLFANGMFLSYHGENVSVNACFSVAGPSADRPHETTLSTGNPITLKGCLMSHQL